MCQDLIAAEVATEDADPSEGATIRHMLLTIVHRLMVKMTGDAVRLMMTPTVILIAQDAHRHRLVLAPATIDLARDRRNVIAWIRILMAASTDSGHCALCQRSQESLRLDGKAR